MAAGGPTTTTSTLSGSAPAFLTDTSTTPVATQTATTAAPQQGNLPFTGDNLLPESIAAVLLVVAGVLLRLRWRPRW
jgi:hypothetical protein